VQAISRATLDLDTANLRSAQAQVAAQMQAIDEKIVRAPFGGKLGLRLVDTGQYLPAGTPVANLQALDPVYVDFNVAQQQLAHIAPGQAVAITVDAWPGRVFSGSVGAIDNRVDAQSRMASVRASLDNRSHALLPGMFAIVSLEVGEARQVLTVPQAAISYNPYGNFIYVIRQQPGSAGLVAASRVVRLGDKQGDRVVVLAGLAPGDRVVTAGQLKLRDGSPVRIDNSVQPENSLLPDPVDE
jgi:membrane fusion protein (multidrug efflux system)